MNGADDLPLGLRQLIDRLSQGDRSTALGLEALVLAARPDGRAVFNDVAIRYRDDYLELMRAEGRDVEREAGRLGLDEVRAHLATSVMPRLAADGVIVLPQQGITAPDAVLSITEHYWGEMAQYRSELAEVLRHTSEHAVVAARPTRSAAPTRAGRQSVLTADGLVKTYRRRRVVNDVALRLQQGEIVGLLGPNGAGKTTTFYMIVGLIQPQAGTICFDGDDITDVPMYKRARRGIGYLSQEPSIFRKLTVEQNILAILETMDLSREQRRERLEKLLDELSIKHLRKSRAFALSGGERRRLEITRALVTQPKFMMLDEPFAGVDPIAVHDIQSIVAGLRHRGIGVLISDHNVEQTLDIVDRAYIMFDGQVKVSGTVRELVFDDTVAKIYLGPTLTARLRSRFAASENGGSAV
jgi:lipopolysaccharide export system ATP-binding protein